MSDKKYDFSDFDAPVSNVDKSQYDFSDFENKDVQSNESGKSEVLDNILTAADQFTAGTAFNFKPRMEGAVNAALRATGITNADRDLSELGYESPTLDLETLSKAYEQGRKSADARLMRQEKTKPVLSTAFNVAGGFVAPVLGAAKLLGPAATSAQKVIGSGIAGATGSGLTTLGEQKDLTDANLLDVSTDALKGAGLGAALGGTGVLLGKALKSVNDTKFAEDVAKVYNKAKSGQKISGKEQELLFNKGAQDTASDVTDELVSGFEKYKNEYGKAINKLKVGKPEAVKKELDSLIDDLVAADVSTGGIDPRVVNNKIQKLRDSKALNESEVADLFNTVRDRKSVGGIVSNEQQFQRIGTNKEQAANIKNINDDIMDLRGQKRELQKQLKELKRIPKEERDLLEQRVLEDEIQKLDDALFSVRSDLADTRFDLKNEKLNTSVLQKANKDITADASVESSKISELTDTNANINRLISELVQEQQATGNTAVSGLINEVNKLKSGLDTSTLGQIKDARINSLQSYAEQMGRKDLVEKISNIVKKNTPGAEDLDKGYRDQIANLKMLGIVSDDSAQATVKDANVMNNLTELFKASGRNETGSAANRLKSIEDVTKNDKVKQLLSQGREFGEGYTLNQKMSNVGLTTPGGYALRGAEATGGIVNSLSKVNSAISKMPVGSVLRNKLVDITKMEPNAQQRAIFTLSQQPWFRKISGQTEEEGE